MFVDTIESDALSQADLEAHFAPFREGIIGQDTRVETPYGSKPLVYADWIASGRLYQPIEDRILRDFGPLVANTHTESNLTGTTMTRAYHHAHRIIKAHVNAGPGDVILTVGTGMTGAICKFQRILGLRVPEWVSEDVVIAQRRRPVIFVTHMEHHSNQTSWLETIGDVVVIPMGADGLVDPPQLEALLAEYADRETKIGAFTACSNVTGIRTPYHTLAKIMHAHGGLCFVDFAANAPYDPINMHPADPAERLDAIYFSPHKFLGGPGSTGVLIFDRTLYRNRVPDNPGGGTVMWTNPWGGRSYIEDIEAREDGGTPGFLQAIRAALAVRVKEAMGVEAIKQREKELVHRAIDRLEAIPGLHVLAGAHRERIGAISFYIEDLHYNLAVKMLCNQYGIQVRGGCSCAGTYGHFLMHVGRERSKAITCQIDRGDQSAKPGWIRLSLHPTMTDAELDYILHAIDDLAANVDEYKQHYTYLPTTNEWTYRRSACASPDVEEWFSI
ncbi:MAG: aminotransferase class V-fold PLP-dependent enzyme [Bacteroidota bacterium]